MLKTIAFTALAVAVAAPAAAQMAAPPAGGALPKCSATVHDSCDQGADNANAISAEQAMKTGGVGDRGHDDAANMGGDKPMMTHKHKAMRHKAMKKAAAPADAPAAADKPM